MRMWILAMTMTVAVAANAQDKKHLREHFKPEQRAELQAKRMTLALDLNEKQQKEVQTLLLENGKARAEYRRQHMADWHAGKKLSTDEKFALKSKMLDDRIAMNSSMKKILTDKQFEKFGEMKTNRQHEAAKRIKSHKKHPKR